MIINLCFHGIGILRREREPGEARYWVTTDGFHRIMDALDDIADIALSFDDGNLSDHAIALPTLVERGRTATFFPLAGRLADADSLGAPELRDLRAAGMRVGTHGWAHVPWRGLTTSDARRELVEARGALAEASGGTITQAALPLGRYDRQLIGRLKAADYDTVFTSDRFPAHRSSWLQARYSVTAQDTAESVKAIVRRRLRPADAVNAAKSLLKRLR